VNGSASVYLNGANTYTGSTMVESGVLGGNGTIAGAVTVQNGAYLTPGSAKDTIGTLGVGSLQLDSGATAAMSISGTAPSLYDQVVALGNVNYGGSLAIDFTTAGFANFDAWQLFSGASHSGHLSSVAASGAYGSLTFNYIGSGEWKATGGLLAADQSLSFYEDNSHAIGSRYQAGQLVLVPEPSTFVIAGIGLVVMGWRGWSRRRSQRRPVDSTASV
jgi:autotransporter-associated beta strand protein